MTPSALKVRFDILKGPSKFDLMVSLFSGTFNIPHPISFSIKGVIPVAKVQITGVLWESGGGDQWVLYGYQIVGSRDISIFGHLFNPESGRLGNQIKAYYSTETRRGFIEPKIQPD